MITTNTLQFLWIISFIFQCINIIERLDRIGGLRKEEFIILKALILANSFTINSSLNDEDKSKEDCEKEEIVDKTESDSIYKIEQFRESLMNSLYDCILVTRYGTLWH